MPARRKFTTAAIRAGILERDRARSRLASCRTNLVLMALQEAAREFGSRSRHSTPEPAERRRRTFRVFRQQFCCDAAGVILPMGLPRLLVGVFCSMCSTKSGVADDILFCGKVRPRLVHPFDVQSVHIMLEMHQHGHVVLCAI